VIDVARQRAEHVAPEAGQAGWASIAGRPTVVVWNIDMRCGAQIVDHAVRLRAVRRGELADLRMGRARVEHHEIS